ncbi:hypothetical protein B0H12DRAFT_1139622 [Mycena haematopus]|nr:hypothetical protein B0H12DRAFT_1139622 [Mycena haematopus]
MTSHQHSPRLVSPARLHLLLGLFKVVLQGRTCRGRLAFGEYLGVFVLRLLLTSSASSPSSFGGFCAGVLGGLLCVGRGLLFSGIRVGLWGRTTRGTSRFLGGGEVERM